MGTIIGVAITGAIGIINNIINKRYEAKRQKKEAIIKVGLEYWSTLINARQGVVGPPEQYIAHIANLMDQILDDRFDKDKFKNALIENSKLQTEIADIILERDRMHRDTQAKREKKPDSSDRTPDKSGPDPLLQGPPFSEEEES